MRVQHAVKLYFDTRRAHGYPNLDTRILKRFCRAVGPDRQLRFIRPVQVYRFIDGGRPVNGGWENRYYTLRKFYRFAIARHLTGKDPCPTSKPKRDALFRPYIYSLSELQRLFDSCNNADVKWKTLHPQTFRTLAILLYGAGLRLGEALRLMHSDIDFSEGLLTIRCSKFGKTRVLPFGSDLAHILQEYIRSGAHAYKADASSLVFAYQDGSPILSVLRT